MTRHAWTAIVMVLVSALGLPAGAAAQGDVTATLSVLAAPVERVGAGVVGAEPGATGMNLAEGDRVRTGAGGLALITFLNGTTVTVLPDSEVTVKQASTGRGTGGLRILLHAGRVWARVVQVAGNRRISPSSPTSTPQRPTTASSAPSRARRASSAGRAAGTS